MTEPSPTPPHVSTRRLRVAQTLVLSGLVGLCAAFFLPHENEGEGRAPLRALMEIGWDRLMGEGVMMLAPFFFAPILLLFRMLSMVVRRERFLGWAGWIAAAFGFGLFMWIDLVMWRNLPIDQILGRAGDPGVALILAWFAVAGVSTLAMLMLCAAPARARLPACFAVVGAYSVFYFFLWLIASLLVSARPTPCGYGLYVSLVSALLVAVGGIWETKLLWRRA